MDVNFKGLVDLHSLPTSEPLLPLFEAIVNSIQSINEAHISNGEIIITIEREQDQLTFGDWETNIDNIIIQDNGRGFTTENFKSFNTYASDFKKTLGCKGVGRMMWLKAFDSVKVESTYTENGKCFFREFNFDGENDVNNMKLFESDNGENITKVSLKGLKSKSKTGFPKKINTIARDILNHCFLYFVLESVPRIVVCDDDDSVCVNSMFSSIKKENIKTDSFTIDKCDFKLIHYRNYNPSSSNHCLNLCANDRKVTSINLHNILKGINGKISTSMGEFLYYGFITSNFLDENVNRERTEFNLEEEQQTLFNGSITKNSIVEKAADFILDFLNEDIISYNKMKSDRIKSFISHTHPRYKYLLSNYPECLNNICLSDDSEKLELELFKQEQQYKLLLKQEGSELQKEIKNNSNSHEILKKTTEFAGKLSELGKSNLVEYIVHRRAVLDILQNNLKYQNDEEKSFAYEESIHQLIFPMQSSSDDIDYMSHNLWLIDEKLAYHYYLASDIKFSDMPVLESESENKPDIAIFDYPFAFTDEDQQPFRNITIIEFKRPGREYYSNEKNPINQVIEYMDDILNGKIKAKNGQPIEGNEGIRFYCYILCDLNNKIKDYAKKSDFQITPDGMGRYKYLANYNAYIEIIPYIKMVQDSNKRNKILFDKLFNQQ